MAPIQTAPNEIDRKLHRIVLDSNPERFTNMIRLGKFIEGKECVEFSYSRADGTHYSLAETIQNYVNYAQKIALLNGDLESTRPKSDIRTLENFQHWLSDNVVQYLNNNNCSIDRIRETVQALLQSVPFILPTLVHIRSRLQAPPSLSILRLSFKIVSILRPQALKIQSRRLLIIPDLFQD